MMTATPTYRWPVNIPALEAKAASVADLVESLWADDYAVPGSADWQIVTATYPDWREWECTCDWQKAHTDTDPGGRGCSHVRAVRMLRERMAASAAVRPLAMAA